MAGGIDTEGLEVAAQLGALGIDPVLFLTTTDSTLRNAMLKLGERIGEHKQRMDKNLAAEIANAVGKLFK